MITGIRHVTSEKLKIYFLEWIMDLKHFKFTDRYSDDTIRIAYLSFIMQNYL